MSFRSVSHCAIWRPLASCRAIRSGSVLVPRRQSQQSIGPGTRARRVLDEAEPLGEVLAVTTSIPPIMSL